MVYSRRPASFFSYLPNQHLENSIAMTLCTCLQRFGTVWARFSIFQSSSILFLSARADAALSKTGPTDNSATTGANFFGCTHKLRPPRPTRLISALSRSNMSGNASAAQSDDGDKDPVVTDKKAEPKVTKGKAKSAKKATKNKRFRSKKPKDMPPRPLSAYNLFFKEERVRMLTGDVASEGDDAPKRIGFEAMAKTIGKRWKELPESELARYKAEAKDQMDNYRREMDKYHLNVAKRARLEKEQAAAQKAEEEAAAAAARKTMFESNPQGDMQQMVPGLASTMGGSNSAAMGGSGNFDMEQLLRAQQGMLNPAMNVPMMGLGANFSQFYGSSGLPAGIGTGGLGMGMGQTNSQFFPGSMMQGNSFPQQDNSQHMMQNQNPMAFQLEQHLQQQQLQMLQQQQLLMQMSGAQGQQPPYGSGGGSGDISGFPAGPDSSFAYSDQNTFHGNPGGS